MKKQAAAGAAAGAAAVKEMQRQADQALHGSPRRRCSTRASASSGQCYAKKNDKQCQRDVDARPTPEVSKSCDARVAEFCKRCQTAGRLHARRAADENAAQMCGVSAASIKAAQCPKARADRLARLPRRLLPGGGEADRAWSTAPGRDYTSKHGRQVRRVLRELPRQRGLRAAAGRSARRPAAGKSASGTAGASGQRPGQPQSTADQVKQGVSKGLDKLQGPVRPLACCGSSSPSRHCLAAGAAHAAEDPYPWIAAAYLVKRDGKLLWAGAARRTPAARQPRQADDRAARARARQAR